VREGHAFRLGETHGSTLRVERDVGETADGLFALILLDSIFEGARESGFIGKFEIAADRKTARDA